MKQRDDRVGALFKEHQKAVKSTLRRLGVHEVEVDDLLQNVFLSAQRRIAKLPKDPEGARRWLIDAARKQAANWRRLFRHRYEMLGCDEVVMETAAEPADPEVYLVLRDLVWCAIDALEEPERRILVLHHLGGQSMGELGKLLGLTKAGAHVRVQRAEERMRELVSGSGARAERPRHL